MCPRCCRGTRMEDRSFFPGVGAVARRRFPVLEGLGSRDNTSIFVSRGMGTVYVPVRINCPPEVAVITLKRRSQI